MRCSSKPFAARLRNYDSVANAEMWKHGLPTMSLTVALHTCHDGMLLA